MRCDQCKHSMYGEEDKGALLYCIALPPTPIRVKDKIMSCFPMMNPYAKCGKFVQGETQELSKP